MGTTMEQKPVFRDLRADDPDPEVTEIESFCVNCHSNGMTRLLLTRIPYYKNVVLMSFSCEECGYENNEVQSGGAYPECGVRWELRVETHMDLNRQVVKSDHTSVRIPALDLEIPAQSQKGEVTTVEGILERAIAGLSQDQAVRKQQHPNEADQIDSFIERIRAIKDVEARGAFVMHFEDISGDCFIENPVAPKKDPRCTKVEFQRSPDQDHALGIFTRDEVADMQDPAADGLLTTSDPASHTYEQLSADDIMTFRTNCPECNAPADTNMKLTKIPHFKEVVIMATNCEACGHRTNEVKSGGGIEEKGVRFEVTVASKDDFSRDILKSETCSMLIPELDLEVGGRALGGRFTTAEGLLRATLEQIQDGPGVTGDAPSLSLDGIHIFVEKMNEVLEGKRKVTIVLEDPAGNSYVQSLAEDPTQPDDGLKITHFERTYDQNEDLGLNDMKTEGYEQSS